MMVTKTLTVVGSPADHEMYAAPMLRWYHGTNARLAPGDVLVPGLGAVHGNDNDVVWVANNAWVASAYGCRTYEVVPHDVPRKRNKAGEFRCASASVVREITAGEIVTAGNEWAALPVPHR